MTAAFAFFFLTSSSFRKIKDKEIILVKYCSKECLLLGTHEGAYGEHAIGDLYKKLEGSWKTK